MSEETKMLMEALQAMREELVALKEAKTAVTTPMEARVNDGLKKNQKPGKAHAGRRYVRLSAKLADWGTIPQQQADIADILCKNMKVDVEYTEQEVYDWLIDGAGDYVSLYTSKQDPTYLFRYYRGLRALKNHAGYIFRNFLRQIN